MGLLGGKKEKTSANGMHIDGLDHVAEKAPCKVTLEGNSLIIDELTLSLKGTKTIKTFNIPMERVISIEVVNEETIKELSKSVIKRGITGGVLFGSAGIILGGMSGIGNKQKKEKRELLCVSYEAKESEEIKTVILEQYKNKWDIYDFVKEYKKRYESESQPNQTITL